MSPCTLYPVQRYSLYPLNLNYGSSGFPVPSTALALNLDIIHFYPSNSIPLWSEFWKPCWTNLAEKSKVIATCLFQQNSESLSSLKLFDLSLIIKPILVWCPKFILKTYVTYKSLCSYWRNYTFIVNIWHKN